MEFLDARRLTGPNLLSDGPGAILDVRCSSEQVPGLVEAWERAVSRMLDALGWQQERLTHKPLAGGVSLAFSAPIDALYAATEVNEWVWSEIGPDGGNTDETFEQAVDRIRASIEEERRPALLSLEAAARTAEVPFLWDDDDVSVGYGRYSTCWPVDQLPEPQNVDWPEFQSLPIGVVTGTNGKTTTVRMASHIAGVAGRSVGVSCTDWISVGGEVVDRGDWSGPGGARAVLRRSEVDFAILETARGGLLRRGLGVERADAALITNIAEDHLGDFGSSSLAELLDIKWIVSRAVRQSGVLILNADDELLVAKARDYDGELQWFSLHPGNPLITEHIAAGGCAWLLKDGWLQRASADECDKLCAVQDMPVTLGGAARHNVANALAAAALTSALGIPLSQIATGLCSMQPADNPGRSNVHDVDGVTVLVDFAHNPHAMQAMFDLARAMPAKRRFLAFGQAGDRTDEQIRELARGAWQIGLDEAIVSELRKYHRGREEGEVFGIIRGELESCGAKAESIHHVEEELEALELALGRAAPGDLIIVLALAAGEAVNERLVTLTGRRTPP